MGRGRALRARAPRLAVRASWRASDFDARRAHARRRLHDAPRPARAATSTATPCTTGCARRKGARMTALTSGGTIPETGDYAVVLEPQAHDDRHRQRGLRGREHGRRHLPARQRELPHPARRARPRARRGRAGRAAEHPVLARRGAGPQRRAVARRSRGCAPRSASGSRATATTRRSRALARATIGLDAEAARQIVDYLARARAVARRAADAASASSSSASSTPSGGMQLVDPFAVRQPPQPRLGPGAAQALLPPVQLRAAGGGDRGRDRAVAVDQPQLPARRGGALPAFGDRARRARAGAARRAAVRRALALERDHRARACRASSAAGRSRRSCSA